MADSISDGTDEIGCVALEVRTLLADAIEELTTKGEIGDKARYHRED
ncbi:hypothetical protein BC936DRAFT_140823 [Jimgerdemannia flammicorona]|uniref:Uncharacterized protein n=1 Tax=Jimgerdemannia flammicorona TaxID=994334 RepID=A0A433DGN8_9FUNG|nr:hypothetical protein BC936DRAFT_140823 [Jimgerdemannia flammicorona]